MLEAAGDPDKDFLRQAEELPRTPQAFEEQLRETGTSDATNHGQSATGVGRKATETRAAIGRCGPLELLHARLDRRLPRASGRLARTLVLARGRLAALELFATLVGVRLWVPDGDAKKTLHVGIGLHGQPVQRVPARALYTPLLWFVIRPKHGFKSGKPSPEFALMLLIRF